MQRIAEVGGLFISGNPATNTKGTIVTADWLNAIQEELAAIVEADGGALVPANNGQVLAALATAIQSGKYVTAVAGGTVNAITVSLSPAAAAFYSGPIFWRASGANTTTTPTLKRNSLAAKTIVKGNNLPLANGDIPGAGCWMCSQYDATLNKEVLLNPATGINPKNYSEVKSVGASVGSNALTVTLNPTTLDFRSQTLASGSVNTRSVDSILSMTVSSGSTLGMVNNQVARIIILAIDNAGAVELAVANLAGGLNLDETTLISTTAEGGAGAADSAGVIYSTTARSNVPFRILGFLDITQATAGTWASAPTLVQGQGGQSLTALQSLGYGQTWQNVTGSRTLGTTYYNTTGRPIEVKVSLQGAVGGVAGVQLTINAVALPSNYITSVAGGASIATVSAIVPPGASYSAAVLGGGSLAIWAELR